ncbi:MAG: hypothetical protein H6799_01155 [Candidatus Nomurabacteria bacterium]|nr:MAG: hypothetical protein H6799_01155 [Candidatus Nomurabacteria bacterium]HRV76239.1 hypothetical protein [Candidatus Saccharimonadales bacterium]
MERVHEARTYFENDIKTVAQVEIRGESDKVLDLGCSTLYMLMEGSGSYTVFNEDGSVRKTVELNRPGQTFFAFRGFPYMSKGFGVAGMKVVAVSYPPFDLTEVSVVE